MPDKRIQVGDKTETIVSHPVVYTTREVADLLKISQRTLEKEIAEGKLCPIWIRNSRRFTVDEVLRYLHQNDGDNPSSQRAGGLQ